jgi:hypothetical protein
MRNEGKEDPVTDSDRCGIHARWILRIREELKCVEVLEARPQGKQVRKGIVKERGVVWGYAMEHVAAYCFEEQGHCE